MNEKIQCRPASREDLERIWNQSISNHPGDPQWLIWKDQFILDNIEGRAQTFVISYSNQPSEGLTKGDDFSENQLLREELIGEATLLLSPLCTAIRGREQLADQKQIANINALRIQASFEGRGYASALIRTVEKWALKKGYEKLSIGVEACESRNRAIYQHWGFNDFIHSEIEDGDEVLYFSKRIK